MGGGRLRTFFEKTPGNFHFFNFLTLPLEIPDKAKLKPGNSTNFC